MLTTCHLPVCLHAAGFNQTCHQSMGQLPQPDLKDCLMMEKRKKERQVGSSSSYAVTRSLRKCHSETLKVTETTCDRQVRNKIKCIFMQHGREDMNKINAAFLNWNRIDANIIQSPDLNSNTRRRSLASSRCTLK